MIKFFPDIFCLKIPFINFLFLLLYKLTINEDIISSFIINFIDNSINSGNTNLSKINYLSMLNLNILFKFSLF